uniref:FBD domain-containing protein n=1 Tax=Chenopodium quinoa TaxID=63459 RepID=A0A803LEP8_CHEQI
MLENLVFPGGLSLHKLNFYYDHTSFWSDLETSSSCLSSHLKTITIASFHGKVDEVLNITKYLLRYGKVLTKLILCCKLKSKKEYTEIKELFMIGRLASKECSLDLMIE